jgi:threonine/homoserine/homoserine lactone efflux protein
MNTFEFWTLYTITVFISSIIPGPSMLLALAHGIKYGTKVSIITALGNSVASMIQATIAIAGLGIVLSTSTTFFLIIKYIGVVYLIYLGIKLYKAPFTIDNNNDNKKEKPVLKKLFSEAFIVAAANPKALLFFTALFPQFIQETRSGVFHYTLLVLSLGIIAFICMMIYSFSGYKVKNFFTTNIVSKYIGKIIGSIFVSLGIGLAFTSK